MVLVLLMLVCDFGVAFLGGQFCCLLADCLWCSGGVSVASGLIWGCGGLDVSVCLDWFGVFVGVLNAFLVWLGFTWSFGFRSFGLVYWIFWVVFVWW